MVAQLQKRNPMVTKKVKFFSKSHVIIKCQVSTNTDVPRYLLATLLLFNEKKNLKTEHYFQRLKLLV